MKKYIFYIFIFQALFSSLFAQESSNAILNMNNDSLLSISHYPLQNKSSLLNNWKKQNIESRNYNNDFSPEFSKVNIEFKNDPAKLKINKIGLYSFSTAIVGAAIGLHIYQSNSWWKKDSMYTGKFSFVNDGIYANNFDKFGHFYATHLIAHGISGWLDYADLETEKVIWYSASLALAYELYIEIQDGFATPRWGFSPGDATADILGASMFVLRYYYPYLNNIQFKFSYHTYPNEQEFHRFFMDSYQYQKLWASFRVKEMLPENVSKYWPSFLNIAAGYHVHDWDGYGGGRSEIYLAFDFNAEVLPIHGRLGNFIKNTLNYIHFPMPGMRITPNATFFMFCF